MTKLLAEAFQKASELPENLQDELARELLDGLAWEARWDQALAESGEALDRMAEQALKEHRTGRTREMGFDEL
jgi:hypothetical protein